MKENSALSTQNSELFRKKELFIMKSALNAITAELDAIRAAGTWREERIITTPQRSRIDTTAK